MDEVDEVRLRFEAFSADLLATHTKTSSERRRSLQFLIRPTDRFEFSSGTSLKEYEWHLAVTDAEFYNEHAEKLGALGFLMKPYGGEEAKFERGFIACAISHDSFQPLLDAVLAGRLPKNITVTVKSPAIVWHEHDLHRPIWTLANDDRSAPVVAIDFFAPLISAPSESDTDPVPPAQTLSSAPANTGDIQTLTTTVRESILKIQSQIRWLTIGAAIVAVLLLFVRR